ncbi:MAG TPA: trehalase family glycosidase, partial [Patescibacteria group bacterium]
QELEKDYGIVQSQRFSKNLQWDWPNGWAPMQLRVVEGLIRYGYKQTARRIIKKWLACNIKVFAENGKLWEKYDVVKGRVGVPDRYPTQPGFGWTNATFLILTKILKSLEEVTPRQDLLRHPDASWLTKLALRY